MCVGVWGGRGANPAHPLPNRCVGRHPGRCVGRQRRVVELMQPSQAAQHVWCEGWVFSRLEGGGGCSWSPCGTHSHGVAGAGVLAGGYAGQ